MESPPIKEKKKAPPEKKSKAPLQKAPPFQPEEEVVNQSTDTVPGSTPLYIEPKVLSNIESSPKIPFEEIAFQDSFQFQIYPGGQQFASTSIFYSKKMVTQFRLVWGHLIIM